MKFLHRGRVAIDLEAVDAVPVGDGVVLSFLAGIVVTLALQVAETVGPFSGLPFTSAPHETLPLLILYTSPLLFFLAAVFWKQGRRRVQAIDIFYIAATLVSLVSFLSTWRSLNPVNPIYQVVATLYFYALVRLLSPSLKRLLPHLMSFVLGMICVEALLAVLQFYSAEFPRGHFRNPNELAMYLTLGVPMALALAWSGFRLRWVFGMITGIFLYAIILTDCRTALLALTLVLPLMAAWHFRRLLAWGLDGSRRWIVLCLLLVVAAGVAYVAWGYYQLRPRSVWGRLLGWEITLRVLRDHWLTGVGFDNLQSSLTQQMGDYFQEGTASETEKLVVSYFGSALNDYLETAATLGLLGLVCYIPFWLLAAGRALVILAGRVVVALHDALRGEMAVERDDSRLYSGLAAVVLLYLLMAFFYYPARLPPLVPVFNFSLALIVGLGRGEDA